MQSPHDRKVSEEYERLRKDPCGWNWKVSWYVLKLEKHVGAIPGKTIGVCRLLKKCYLYSERFSGKP